MLRATLAVIAGLVSAAPAAAEAQASPKKVALGTVDSLGGEVDATVLKVVERALAERGGVEVIAGAQIRKTIRRARKPQLASCEGDRDCLVEMGELVGADLVVSLEVSGLGDVRLLHFKLIDVGRKRAIRSTTAELGADGLEPGALVRLLSPRGYRGRLALAINAKGAQIFVDGKRMAVAPINAPLNLRVGTHALRITHPNYRDYVRFVDIAYAGQVDLDVDMKPIGVVSGDVTGTGGGRRAPGDDRATPWYGRWYVIAGVGAVVLGGSIAIWAATNDGLDFDRERP